MAVTDYLERGTLVNPDGACLVAGEEELTYRELSALVNRVANGLLAAGLGLGRSVAVLCDNEPRGYACTLGVTRAGAAYVPLDCRNSVEDNARSLEFGGCETEWGEAVKAVGELRPGAALSEAEVIARCKERVGSVKAPKSVDFVRELPRSQRGKLLKRVLREPHWEGRTRRV